MIKDKKETTRRVQNITCHLDDLAQQQMEVLTSIQKGLMNLESFRIDAEESTAQLKRRAKASSELLNSKAEASKELLNTRAG